MDDDARRALGRARGGAGDGACIGGDAYGARGVQIVAPGDEIEATLYVGSNHDGLYRELACGAENEHEDFAEVRLAVEGAIAGCVAGRSDRTSAGVARDRRLLPIGVRCQGAPCAEMAASAELLGEPGGWAALRAHSEGQWPTETCRLDPSRCFLTDRVTLPEATTCRGPATLRMIWNAGRARGVRVVRRPGDLGRWSRAADAAAASHWHLLHL